MKTLILLLSVLFTTMSFAQNVFNWQQISSDNIRYTRIVKTNNGQFLCGSQGENVLYRSTDLNSFVPQQSNLASHNLAFGKDNNGILYFGTGHTGVFKSIDNGNNWIYNVADGGGCGALDFTCDANNKLFVSIGGYLRGLYVSSDDGATWSNTYPGNDFLDIEVNNANNLVLITSGGRIYSSPIQNISWNEITGQSFNNNVIMVKSLENNIFVFTNNGSIYKSTNGGINWILYSQIPIAGIPSGYLNDAILKNDGIWYVGLDSQGVWRSVDDGITWQNINQGINGNFSYLFYDMPNVVVTTSTGIFKLIESSYTAVLSGDATICSGASTNLSVVVTGGTAPYTVTVTDGTNNYTATSASPVSIPVSPTATSTYTIVSVSGGGTGTGNTGTATVTVTPNPTAIITATGPLTFCSGSSVVLTASGGTSYSWSTGATTASITATTSGSYTVQVTDNVNGCISLSAPTVLTITPSSTNTTTTAACDSYTWNGTTYTTSGVYLGTTTNCVTQALNLTINTNTSSSISQTALDSYTWPVNNQTYTTTGAYTTVIPNAAGCDSTITLNLTMSFTGINELSASKLSVFPNPTNGDFTITGLELLGTVSSLTLNDMNGKVVKVLDTKATKFSMALIKSGVYFLNIRSGNKQEVLKIVKE